MKKTFPYSHSSTLPLGKKREITPGSQRYIKLKFESFIALDVDSIFAKAFVQDSETILLVGDTALVDTYLNTLGFPIKDPNGIVQPIILTKREITKAKIKTMPNGNTKKGEIRIFYKP